MPINESTIVDTTDATIESLLAGSNSVMIADNSSNKPPSMFSRGDVDLTFLDNNSDNSDDSDNSGTNTGSPDDRTSGADSTNNSSTDNTGTSVLDNLSQGVDTDEDIKKTKSGRPTNIVELTNKLIEKNLIVPFNDDVPLDQYTLKDFEELYEQNDQERQKKLMEEIPLKFFDSLPEQLQYAAKYVADGGKDLKGLFQVLAQSEEVVEMDISNERGQENVIRAYLQSTSFGTDEDIEEEIAGWKDREELESKAKKFKPKLEAIQEKVIADKLKRQEEDKKKQIHQANIYKENLYKVLEPDDLNGLKLDKKVKNMIYTGLIQPNYPSISGRNTNLLGHLLEKYQWVEPRHDLIAEALWLLSDPDGYKSKVKEIQKKETVASTVRALKTAEQDKKSSTQSQDNDQPGTRKTGISRPSTSQFFKR